MKIGDIEKIGDREIPGYTPPPKNVPAPERHAPTPAPERKAPSKPKEKEKVPA